MLPFLLENYDLTPLSTMRIPARARYFYEIKSVEELSVLEAIAHFASERRLPIVYLGGGSNILFAADTIEAIVVKCSLKWRERLSENIYRVASGESTTAFASDLYKESGISALLPWIGLPGTIGGGTVGNAGCFGLEWAGVLVECEVLNISTRKKETLSKEDLHYTYRHSILRESSNSIVLSATFDLWWSNWENPFCQMTPKELLARRREKQPNGFSCGSFFGNSTLGPAGKLLEEVGMKGEKIGGIEVSQQHANFWINIGGGRWQDVLALRDIAKARIMEKYRITLREEVRILGSDGKFQ